MTDVKAGFTDRTGSLIELRYSSGDDEARLWVLSPTGGQSFGLDLDRSKALVVALKDWIATLEERYGL